MMAARAFALTQGIQALAGVPVGDGMPVPGNPPQSPTAAPAAAKGAARTKLWALERKFHCLTIGTCIPVAELAKIARRFAFTAKPTDDFGVHVEAVAHCGARNAVSESVQRLLDRLYAAALRDFAALRNAAQLRERWDQCFARGQVAGPLWAALTHKLADAELRQAIYAQVHMLSHQVGAGLAADRDFYRVLERLEADGCVEGVERGRWVVELTDRGRGVALDMIDPDSAWASQWDGRWRTLSFDLPQTAVKERARLLKWLRGKRFGRMQGSLWISHRLYDGWAREIADRKVDPKSVVFLESVEIGGRSDSALAAGHA